MVYTTTVQFTWHIFQNYDSFAIGILICLKEIFYEDTNNKQESSNKLHTQNEPAFAFLIKYSTVTS